MKTFTNYYVNYDYRIDLNKNHVSEEIQKNWNYGKNEGVGIHSKRYLLDKVEFGIHSDTGLVSCFVKGQVCGVTKSECRGLLSGIKEELKRVFNTKTIQLKSESSWSYEANYFDNDDFVVETT